MTGGGGRHYERIVAELTAAMAAAEAVRTLKVERDAEVPGRTAAHAADVYWEFTDGDIVYKTLVRAREWEREVDGRTLFAFVAEVRDIPGQAAGVWFTQPVYRQEVLRLAQDAGVVLYEVAQLTEEGAVEPVAADVRIEVDAGWAEAEKARLGRSGETIQVSGSPRAMFIYDEAGSCLDSVDGVIVDHLKAARGGGPGRVEHRFAAPAFLRTEDEAFPLVKLSGISFDVVLVDPNELDGRDMAGRIVAAVMRFYSPVAHR